MKSEFRGFPPEALKFLRQLKRNNNREWFQAHKEIYELKIKAPMTELVLELGDTIQPLAPELFVEPKRALFRIYRDIRFSTDKSPYKTHVAAMFYPRVIPKNTGACLYFHIEPAEIMIAGGVYVPDSATQRALRQHIAGNWEEFQAITKERGFKKMFGGLQGERLVRLPSGYSADHPAIEVLRQKQFFVSRTEPPELAEDSKLFGRLLALFKAMLPLVQFLNVPLKSLHSGASDNAVGQSFMW
jgi:uncharacterized protein (TIGR02453 family)